jgi:hypothetical protein
VREIYWWGCIAPFVQGEVFYPFAPSRLEFENFQVYPAPNDMLQEGDCRGQCLEETDSRTGESREPVEVFLRARHSDAFGHGKINILELFWTRIRYNGLCYTLKSGNAEEQETVYSTKGLN